MMKLFKGNLPCVQHLIGKCNSGEYSGDFLNDFLSLCMYLNIPYSKFKAHLALFYSNKIIKKKPSENDIKEFQINSKITCDYMRCMHSNEDMCDCCVFSKSYKNYNIELENDILFHLLSNPIYLDKFEAIFKSISEQKSIFRSVTFIGQDYSNFSYCTLNYYYLRLISKGIIRPKMLLNSKDGKYEHSIFSVLLDIIKNDIGSDKFKERFSQSELFILEPMFLNFLNMLRNPCKYTEGSKFNESDPEQFIAGVRTLKSFNWEQFINENGTSEKKNKAKDKPSTKGSKKVKPVDKQDELHDKSLDNIDSKKEATIENTETNIQEYKSKETESLVTIITPTLEQDVKVKEHTIFPLLQHYQPFKDSLLIIKPTTKDELKVLDFEMLSTTYIACEIMQDEDDNIALVIYLNKYKKYYILNLKNRLHQPLINLYMASDKKVKLCYCTLLLQHYLDDIGIVCSNLLPLGYVFNKQSINTNKNHQKLYMSMMKQYVNVSIPTEGTDPLFFMMYYYAHIFLKMRPLNNSEEEQFYRDCKQQLEYEYMLSRSYNIEKIYSPKDTNVTPMIELLSTSYQFIFRFNSTYIAKRNGIMILASYQNEGMKEFYDCCYKSVISRIVRSGYCISNHPVLLHHSLQTGILFWMDDAEYAEMFTMLNRWLYKTAKMYFSEIPIVSIRLITVEK